jgi:hypothetical protein
MWMRSLFDKEYFHSYIMSHTQTHRQSLTRGVTDAVAGTRQLYRQPLFAVVKQ